MSNKPAHLCIIAVDDNDEAIEKVGIAVVEKEYSDKDLHLASTMEIVSRDFIVDTIKYHGNIINIFTATKKGMGYLWIKGDQVGIYDNKFITTKGNSTTKDNLGELPRIKEIDYV